MAKYLKSRGIDDDDDKQKQPETELESEIMLELDIKVTPTVTREPVVIESEKIGIAETKTNKAAMFKEGIVTKKGAMFRDEDENMRYRLKNIVL